MDNSELEKSFEAVIYQGGLFEAAIPPSLVILWNRNVPIEYGNSDELFTWQNDLFQIYLPIGALGDVMIAVCSDLSCTVEFSPNSSQLLKMNGSSLTKTAIRANSTLLKKDI